MTDMTDGPVSGLALKVERIQRDVKGKDLAARLGVHPSWVSRVESRRAVPAADARRYLEGLAALPTLATEAVA